MALSPGTLLGAYEILAAIGVGGMSASGHAEPRTRESEARHRRQCALAWGPQFARGRESTLEAERQRSVASERGWGPARTNEC